MRELRKALPSWSVRASMRNNPDNAIIEIMHSTKGGIACFLERIVCPGDIIIMDGGIPVKVEPKQNPKWTCKKINKKEV